MASFVQDKFGRIFVSLVTYKKLYEKLNNVEGSFAIEMRKCGIIFERHV